MEIKLALVYFTGGPGLKLVPLLDLDIIQSETVSWPISDMQKVFSQMREITH